MSDTRDWRLIAADMIDARKFSLTTDMDLEGPQMKAASFIFDEGIFYLGQNGMNKVSAMLREAAAKQEPTP